MFDTFLLDSFHVFWHFSVHEDQILQVRLHDFGLDAPQLRTQLELTRQEKHTWDLFRLGLNHVLSRLISVMLYFYINEDKERVSLRNQIIH